MKLVEILITKVKGIGNAEIDMPIFPWLYWKISGGYPLTLFDAISLILALPTIIFSNLVTGKPSSTINGMDAPLLKSDAELPDGTRIDFAIHTASGSRHWLHDHFGPYWRHYRAFCTKWLRGERLDIVVWNELDAGPSSLFGICTDTVGWVA